MGREVKPYDIRFSAGNVKYLLTVKQYGFDLYQERRLQVFEGALAFADMGLDPTTFEEVFPDPDILKEALSLIRSLPKKERIKLARRDVNSIIRAIKPVDWVGILRVKEHIGVI